MVWRLALILAASVLASAAAVATYVGAAACAKCHAEAYRKWSESRHSKMVQPATPQSVRADFSSTSQVVLRGSNYGLRERHCPRRPSRFQSSMNGLGLYLL